MDPMRIDVTIPADGATLTGWLTLPAARPAPLVVMIPGFSAVKEMFLDAYAEAFARAGIATLLVDRRGFGASGGEPRQEIDPARDVADIGALVGYAAARPEIDPARIGLWGTSYGGAVAIVAAAGDPRVRAVVAHVPVMHPPRARHLPAAVRSVAVVTPDPARPAVLPSADAWEFSRRAAPRAPTWQNEVTARTLEHFARWDPLAHLAALRAPLLVVAADDDVVMPIDATLAAFARVEAPKELVRLPGGHFDAYDPAFDPARGPFARASSAATEFLLRRL